MSVLSKLADNVSTKFKKRVFGKTFFCPVCHLELAYADTDKDGLCVCPLCGVVIELADVWGHPLPVVHDVEIKRAQPKARMHPLLTHAPVGLMPFALLGALFLTVVSIVQKSLEASDNSILQVPMVQTFINSLSAVNQVTLALLAIAVGVSLFTAISGYWDWHYRFGHRPYRVIRLKIILSIGFVFIGLIALGLHLSGSVFSDTGSIVWTAQGLVALIAYLGLMSVNMVVIGALGHIGGNLVFGK